MDLFKVILVAATALLFPSCATACTTNERAHRELISSLKTNDYVKYVMNLTDRGCFVHKDPYAPQSQPIEYGGRILDPNTHARILEILSISLTNGARALVLESGSGYLSACLSIMTGRNGVTISVPPSNQLLSLAKNNIQSWVKHTKTLQSLRLKPGEQIKFMNRGDKQAWLSSGPYNGIFVHNTGGGISVAELANMLKVGGRLVGLEGDFGGQQELFMIEHYPRGSLRRVSIMYFTGVASPDSYHPVTQE
ncbi:unnamed protein product [Trichobilharzia szidati]|nr:unnamed protein product [Trichobilharzia szidati]